MDIENTKGVPSRYLEIAQQARQQNTDFNLFKSVPGQDIGKLSQNMSSQDILALLEKADPNFYNQDHSDHLELLNKVQGDFVEHNFEDDQWNSKSNNGSPFDIQDPTQGWDPNDRHKLSTKPLYQNGEPVRYQSGNFYMMGYKDDVILHEYQEGYWADTFADAGNDFISTLGNAGTFTSGGDGNDTIYSHHGYRNVVHGNGNDYQDGDDYIQINDENRIDIPYLNYSYVDGDDGNDNIQITNSKYIVAEGHNGGDSLTIMDSNEILDLGDFFKLTHDKVLRGGKEDDYLLSLNSTGVRLFGGENPLYGKAETDGINMIDVAHSKTIDVIGGKNTDNIYLISSQDIVVDGGEGKDNIQIEDTQSSTIRGRQGADQYTYISDSSGTIVDSLTPAEDDKNYDTVLLDTSFLKADGAIDLTRFKRVYAEHPETKDLKDVIAIKGTQGNLNIFDDIEAFAVGKTGSRRQRKYSYQQIFNALPKPNALDISKIGPVDSKV